MRELLIVGIKRLLGIVFVFFLVAVFLQGVVNGFRWFFYEPNCHHFGASAISACFSEPTFLEKCLAVFSLLAATTFLSVVLGVVARSDKSN